ncbi:MAG: 23S rRNA (pseudouridine(1915)-N(3))-methyltransferase RlmH [Candidatus Cloacimonetes bacterium]|nr:23S rRNA (pseudouridine(1915)-N(3))-methyltransferase RlmH [Candidatus Cloacimonadota bacterium]
MYKIKIICLGKTRQEFIKKGIAEYQKRIAPWSDINWIIAPDISIKKNSIPSEIMKKEALRLNDHMTGEDFNIALDENGREMGSLEFAELLNQLKGKKGVSFFIGGIYGLAEDIKKRCDRELSFSRLTFTHQMIRLILIEQLYRAFTILAGKKYHY